MHTSASVSPEWSSLQSSSWLWHSDPIEMISPAMNLTIRHSMSRRSRGPDQENQNRCSEHHALPHREMKHVEQIAVIAAEQIERDDADHIEYFENDRAGDRADDSQFQRRFEREHRRCEKRHRFDRIASVLDVDAESPAANDRAGGLHLLT